MAGGAATPDVLTYGVPQASGARMSSFTTKAGLRVTVVGTEAEDTDAAFELACSLARSSGALLEMRETIDRLRDELSTAKAALPPREPARLLGTGCARFSSTGVLWLLNRRDGGFGEFGVRFDGWDDLFRRYDVRVTGHGQDEHGAWWSVESKPATPKVP